ncbi:CLUMA_CG012462, isoform A [Clunio marinus]|uniref:CLUMA_CG012462, isoform A n=1 Tax=Clunio marinus TaxID=568069 RepID=A0A1J1IEF0_9DIPT|nr:CLUMA_CG012462, isoform A [Clunio marinus]
MDCDVKFLNNAEEFYEPGQNVKIRVTLNVAKPEKINKIICMFHGYAKCKWYEERGVSPNVYIDVLRGRESYVDETFCLLSDSDGKQVELTTGEHNFDASYDLPSNIPTSFWCRNGQIKYKVRIVVDRSWKMNSNYDFPFTVIQPLNLNSEGLSLRHPIKEEKAKNFMLDFTSEKLYMSASIPFSGYVPGQSINVFLEVNNQSKTHVKEVKISLKKIVLMNSRKPKRNTKELVFSEGKVLTDSIPAQTSRSFERRIIVPSLPPNITNCETIKVLYQLRIKAMTSGFNRCPKIKIPITIGTVPFSNILASPSYMKLPPPTYEEALLEESLVDSSDGENTDQPNYPVFTFDNDQRPTT